MITPAEMIAIRAPTDLFGYARGSVDLVCSSSGDSPSILTNPPSGIAARTYSVSPRRKPKIVGPKPIENFSTFTPFHLARRKWPSSWMKITKPRPSGDLQDRQQPYQGFQRSTSRRAQALTLHSISSVGRGSYV